MSVSIVEGNLLNSNAQYIIHQTNCVAWLVVIGMNIKK